MSAGLGLYLGHFDAAGRPLDARRARYNIVSGAYDEPAAVALLPDGRLLSAGSTMPAATASDPSRPGELSDTVVARADLASLPPDTINLATSPPSVNYTADGSGGGAHPDPTPPPAAPTPPPRPTAVMAGKAKVTGGKAYTFRLTVASAADARAAGVTVSGPGGATQTATPLKLKTKKKTGATTATYRCAAPGGTFDAADNGAYQVRIAWTNPPAASGGAALELTTTRWSVAGQFTVQARPARRARRSNAA